MSFDDGSGFDDSAGFDDGSGVDESSGFDDSSWSSQSATPNKGVGHPGHTHDSNDSIADTEPQDIVGQDTWLPQYDPSHLNEAYTSEPPNLGGQRASPFPTATTTLYSLQGQTNNNYGLTQGDIQTGATNGAYNCEFGCLGYPSTPLQPTTQLPYRNTPSHPRWPSRPGLVCSEPSLPASDYSPAYTSHGVVAPARAWDSYERELPNMTPAALFSSGSGEGHEQGLDFLQPAAISSTYTNGERMRLNQVELSSTPIVSEYLCPNSQLDHNQSALGFLQYIPSPEPTTSYNENVTTPTARAQQGQHYTGACRDCGREFSGTVAADVRHNLKRHQRHSCPERELEPVIQCRGQGCSNVYTRDDNRREHERRSHSHENLPPPSKTR